MVDIFKGHKVTKKIRLICLADLFKILGYLRYKTRFMYLEAKMQQVTVLRYLKVIKQHERYNWCTYR